MIRLLSSLTALQVGADRYYLSGWSPRHSASRSAVCPAAGGSGHRV